MRWTLPNQSRSGCVTAPKLSPSNPPSRLGKAKGKGKGKGKGHSEKPAATRSLDKEPADDQTSGSNSREKSGDDEVTPNADTTGNDDEAADNEEIPEE